MKKLIISLAIAATLTASATITKVLNNITVSTTSTNTSNFSASGGIIPSQAIIVDTTGAQTNYIAASLDGTNFVTVATNVVTAAGTTNFQPSLPTVTIYYRVQINPVGTTTNTVYFSN